MVCFPSVSVLAQLGKIRFTSLVGRGVGERRAQVALHSVLRTPPQRHQMQLQATWSQLASARRLR